MSDSGRDKRKDLKKDLKEEYSHEIKMHHHPLRGYKPLGQIMLATHLIDEKQLDEALSHHLQTGQRIGEVTVSLGFTDEEHIRRLLEHQPTFSLSEK
jgi:AraC-like DNA-binding protein